MIQIICTEQKYYFFGINTDNELHYKNDFLCNTNLVLE